MFEPISKNSAINLKETSRMPRHLQFILSPEVIPDSDLTLLRQSVRWMDPTSALASSVYLSIKALPSKWFPSGYTSILLFCIIIASISFHASIGVIALYMTDILSQSVGSLRWTDLQGRSRGYPLTFFTRREFQTILWIWRILLDEALTTVRFWMVRTPLRYIHSTAWGWIRPQDGA